MSEESESQQHKEEKEVSPGDEQYVHTEAIPAWMAALAKQIIPAALLAAVGSGFLTWHLATTNANDISELKSELREQKKAGAQFTKRDLEKHERRIELLEIWRREHTKWGHQKTGHYDELHRQHEKHLDRLERKIEQTSR